MSLHVLTLLRSMNISINQHSDNLINFDQS